MSPHSTCRASAGPRLPFRDRGVRPGLDVLLFTARQRSSPCTQPPTRSLRPGDLAAHPQVGAHAAGNDEARSAPYPEET